jgi:putative Mg2+ transporter-C (MgtC) family protein
MQLDWTELILRLLVATGAGMLIGIDREWLHKAAGLRTHMLVAVGAAASTILGLQLVSDPTRVIQGVLTGIGFIGAGTILHHHNHPEGVTTAAGVWACTVIGMAAGAGFYKLVVATAALSLFALVACRLIDAVVRRRGQPSISRNDNDRR